MAITVLFMQVKPGLSAPGSWPGSSWAGFQKFPKLTLFRPSPEGLTCLSREKCQAQEDLILLSMDWFKFKGKSTGKPHIS